MSRVLNTRFILKVGGMTYAAPYHASSTVTPYQLGIFAKYTCKSKFNVTLPFAFEIQLVTPTNFNTNKRLLSSNDTTSLPFLHRRNPCFIVVNLDE